MNNNTTLYRAADDDYVQIGTSFSPDRETAEEYQKNPGFGGSNLYRTFIEVKKVLNLINSNDPWVDLSEVVGFEIDSSKYGYHFQRVLATDEDICEKVALAGYDWVAMTEDFPEGSVTYIPVSEEAVEAATYEIEIA